MDHYITGLRLKNIYILMATLDLKTAYYLIPTYLRFEWKSQPYLTAYFVSTKLLKPVLQYSRGFISVHHFLCIGQSVMMNVLKC